MTQPRDLVPKDYVKAVQTVVSGIVDSRDLPAMLFTLVVLVVFGGTIFATVGLGEPLILIAVLVLGFLLVLYIPHIVARGGRAHVLKRLKKYLKGICNDVGGNLSIPEADLRSNVFMPTKKNTLRITPGLHHNMDVPGELRLEIVPGDGMGHGTTGNAFHHGAAVIARAADGWDRYGLDEQQTRLLHPDVKWVVSMPIPKPDGGGQLYGVLCVDCLRTDKTVDALRPLPNALLNWVGLFSDEIEESQAWRWFH